MNVILLREIQNAILKHPEHVDMGTFVNDEHADSPINTPYDCGTTACIFGWASFLSDPDKFREILAEDDWDYSYAIDDHAMEVLDLDDDQAMSLSRDYEWPDEFAKRLYETPYRSQAYAQVVSDRIDYFIKTYLPVLKGIRDGISD